VIEFPKNGEVVEVVPRVRPDLPFALVGRVAVWIESERPEVSAYHLHHPYNNKSFPAVEYFNDTWYYLNWHQGQYYVEPSSQISMPISLRLKTNKAPVIDATLLFWEPEKTMSISDSVGERTATSENEDEPIVTLDQEEEGRILAAAFNKKVNIAKTDLRKAFAFGFDASGLPPMSTYTLQHTVTTTGMDLNGSADVFHTLAQMGGECGPIGERGWGLVKGGGGPPTGEPSQLNSGGGYPPGGLPGGGGGPGV